MFNLLTFGLLIASIFSITSKNPVISVIFLITTFVIAAGYLILLGIKFIGISYIVIYVGAIAVLFLFVIMMINIKLTDILETGSNYTKNLPLAIVIITLFLSILTAILSPLYSVNPLFVTLFNFNSELFDLLNSQYSSPSLEGLVELGTSLDLSSVLNYNLGLSKITNNSDIYFSNFEQIEILGHNLYTFGAILLIILSIILLLAMLATIVISKKNVNI
uniref:NADH-ubiquinone oxidoreductase chain 6 n=1 Tax=Stropharia rugosoannulata TaxID=68746 RepID=A0A3G9HDR5_9AGAR|nr:NADH dehydrogenase subunit 6 [Stropharia rugosoannulata]